MLYIIHNKTHNCYYLNVDNIISMKTYKTNTQHNLKEHYLTIAKEQLLGILQVPNTN